jgi:hypothetical protein
MSDTPLPIRIAQTIGITISSAVSGASLSLSFFVVPRLLEAPTPLLLKQWNSSFDLGKKSIVPLAGVSAASYFYLAYELHSRLSASSSKWKMYLLAGLLSVAIVPYTLGIMMSTNKKLLAKVEETKALSFKDEVVEAGLGDETAHKLVDKWGMLNLGRGALLVLSGVVGAWTALN